MIILRKVQLKESLDKTSLDNSKMNKILGGLLDRDKVPTSTLPPLTERPVSTSVTMAPGILHP